MWASMYARETGKTPQDLYPRIANNIEELRGFFSWDELKHAHNYNKKDLAWMLFVGGCSVLQILEKANLSKPEDLNVKVDKLVIVERDLLLLENQLPYRLLELLCEDVSKLKICMHFFCKLQNMFTVSESPHSLLSRELEHEIMILMFSSPPA
ncbi:hypothetical protein L6164_007778 [Bauhinia variegata]|uniref:Uncharacterized protein n=1 Tax=Bauhinia variegata TaxID=167791 RepID=A0ACB9PDU4_BAUVA|nr:hypothetical protein L6164_007778 [Bauhinia variegata]